MRCFHFVAGTRGHLTSMRVVSFSTLMMFRAGAMDNAEAMMKFVIKKALSDCRKDLEFCDKCYAAWKSGSAER